jgi:hypothetical protein
MCAFMDFTIGLIKHILIRLTNVIGTKPIVNIVHYFPRNRITDFLEICELI